MENEYINIPLISLLPFILVLLSIALFPLFWNHFWEKKRNKLLVAILLSLTQDDLDTLHKWFIKLANKAKKESDLKKRHSVEEENGK